MSGTLFVVATPIGNRDDITLRALQVLKQVDRIAAEDTRHSRMLLSSFAIGTALTSLHEHNEREKSQKLVDLLQQGEDIALISDAGTPLISDPGYPLLKAVIDAGITVVPIPGPSSVITALSAAAVATDRFCFHGFLSHKNHERGKQIDALAALPGSQVLLESTHRIIDLLQQLAERLPERQLVLAKELTKHYERFIRGTAADCLQLLTEDPVLIKGEFVVLIDTAEKQIDPTETQTTIDHDQLLQRLLQDLPAKKASRIVADLTGMKKNQLYDRCLQLQSKTQP